MPKRETAYNFVMLKNLASWLMVLLKVKKSLRWHMQEVMSESFGTIVEELLFLKRSVGDFLGKKRCLNILKSWTDLLNSLFHLNLCQIWLIFHQTDLSTGIFIFKKINTQYHPMLSFRDAMMKSVSKGTYLYWFYNLRGYNIRVRLLFRSILHKSVFEEVFFPVIVCLFWLWGPWGMGSWMISEMAWNHESS